MLRGGALRYELAERSQGIGCGGIGAIQQLVRRVGLARAIDRQVRLLKLHVPYHESDHVLNLTYNVLCGGRVLEDIELRRQDSAFLAALGTQSIPDPTTAGDFCRRFGEDDIWALMAAVNETRLAVWKQHPTLTKQRARIDADGTMVPTTGACKQGMDISHKGTWGYHPLLVSLANTGEPLYLVNRPGNRPSHEGAPAAFDRAVALCRRAGFGEVLLRGDTDFSLTAHFDRWDDDGVRFVFGVDASEPMRNRAEAQPEWLYDELVRASERHIATCPRRRPDNVKERIVKARGFKNLRLASEQIVELTYRPRQCRRDYRVIALRKNITVEQGDLALFDEIRYFFYITNDPLLTPAEVVFEANQRCNQENLIEQLKNGTRALHAGLNTLNANWVYMVAASLGLVAQGLGRPAAADLASLARPSPSRAAAAVAHGLPHVRQHHHSTAGAGRSHRPSRGPAAPRRHAAPRPVLPPPRWHCHRHLTAAAVLPSCRSTGAAVGGSTFATDPMDANPTTHALPRHRRAALQDRLGS
ncbi:MAG: IS1380 family transposase [Proteobacteria bacterium]|nr:IS1380 family transposase [Pseudomonadota bacterium]